MFIYDQYAIDCNFSILDFTSSADLTNAAFSCSSNVISNILSIPFLPTLTGTPTIAFTNSNTTATIFNKIWNSTEFGGDIATYFDNDTWGYFYGTYLV